MNPGKSYASDDLEGKVVGGWRVLKRLDTPDLSMSKTGGRSSCCYYVEKDGMPAFMKVLAYRKAISRCRPQVEICDQDAVAKISRKATEIFNYEKAISELCTNRNIPNVVYCIDSGDTALDGYSAEGRVLYIVYEMADGDVRQAMDLSPEGDFADKLRSLRDVAVGISHLHDNGISHQDIKPSNILCFKNESKIGDLGNSIIFGGDIVCPHHLRFNGDTKYAPPECFFPDFNATKDSLYRIDNFMLGELMVFYFTGVIFNRVINYYLPDELRFLNTRPSQTYSDILPDMMNAFKNALRFFEIKIPIHEVKEGLVSIVSYLCHPDPSRRGHPQDVALPDYDLQRTIRELDVLQAKAEHAMSKK